MGEVKETKKKNIKIIATDAAISYCHNCGEKTADGNYCPYCGTHYWE